MKSATDAVKEFALNLGGASSEAIGANAALNAIANHRSGQEGSAADLMEDIDGLIQLLRTQRNALASAMSLPAKQDALLPKTPRKPAEQISLERYLAAAKTYAEREGHCCPPTTHIEDGVDLGSWLGKQRNAAMLAFGSPWPNPDYPEDLRAQLNSIGMKWLLSEVHFERKFSVLHAFYKNYGHCNVPENYISDNPFKLDLHAWTRRLKRIGPGYLSDSQRQRLEALGVKFPVARPIPPAAPAPQTLEDYLTLLTKYHSDHGNCDVPRHVAHLGPWWDDVRRDIRTGACDSGLLDALFARGLLTRNNNRISLSIDDRDGSCTLHAPDDISGEWKTTEIGKRAEYYGILKGIDLQPMAEEQRCILLMSDADPTGPDIRIDFSLLRRESDAAEALFLACALEALAGLDAADLTKPVGFLTWHSNGLYSRFQGQQMRVEQEGMRLRRTAKDLDPATLAETVLASLQSKLSSGETDEHQSTPRERCR